VAQAAHADAMRKRQANDSRCLDGRQNKGAQSGECGPREVESYRRTGCACPYGSANHVALPG
jgi:hypothetical protein